MEIQSKRVLEKEQQLLELFNLETSKIRVLRISQKQEEDERREKIRKEEEQRAMETNTKKINHLIARASKEDQKEEDEVKKICKK